MGKTRTFQKYYNNVKCAIKCQINICHVSLRKKVNFTMICEITVLSEECFLFLFGLQNLKVGGYLRGLRHS